MPAIDGTMSYVSAPAAGGTIKAVGNDGDGTILAGRGGDDILQGGKYNDILDGGAGSDQLYGGDGADQFRFFANKVDGVDVDRVRDLDFSEGDTLVFGNFASDTFVDHSGMNGFADGGSAIISSWAGVASLVADNTGWVASHESSGNNNLVLTYDFGEGKVQQIVITDGWSHYLTASTPTLV